MNCGVVLVAFVGFFWWVFLLFGWLVGGWVCLLGFFLGFVFWFWCFFFGWFGFFVEQCLLGFVCLYVFPLPILVIRLRQEFILYLCPLFCACMILGTMFIFHFYVSVVDME